MRPGPRKIEGNTRAEGYSRLPQLQERLTTWCTIVIDGAFQGYFGKKRPEAEIDGHCILCGYEREGVR